MDEKLVFEKSKFDEDKNVLSEDTVCGKIPDALRRRKKAMIPELSEPEVVRHFTRLSQKSFSVDANFYPLGSCTMKYNPKRNEDIAAMDGFDNLHPFSTVENSQGTLQLMYELQEYLCEINGMHRFSLQPAAGAHGELLGMMIAKAYHLSKGDVVRTKVIVPDSSHGTNPASAAIYGFEVVQVASDENGLVDLDELRNVVGEDCACLMLTNPNTLGLFEENILEISEIVHAKGGLLYYDGANLNALMGISRPGDMGFDIVHLNLHKTFSTPHGGGGPGAGPVGVVEPLVDFLPKPVVGYDGGKYYLDFDIENSVGMVKAFYGNIGVLIKAYAYIRTLGADGLRRASQEAVINANYLRVKVARILNVPYNKKCMHEFVATPGKLIDLDVHAGDIAKRLLDYGIHAPTVYFPLIVPEALMIEPTETESKETLDFFVDVIAQIVKDAQDSPEYIKNAPYSLSRKRCDEVLAARKPNLCYVYPA